MFLCSSCGHNQMLPEQLGGRKAKCPKCGQLGSVGQAPKPEPDINDVALDDLVEADPVKAMPAMPAKPASPAGSLALETAASPVTLAEHFRHFFSGRLPVNFLVGFLSGGHELLVCLALAMLAGLVSPAAGLGPQALTMTLLPVVFGSVLFALHGRLAVAVGGPDPSAVLAVFLLLGALGADLSGRVPEATLSATLLAGLSLAVLLPGVLGVLLSRFGLAERVRYLPNEVLGGMIAGFGLLLVKAWFPVMAHVDPALAVLGTLPLAELGDALTRSVRSWGPAAGFAVVYFLVRIGTRSLVWPLLLSLLAIGAWNLLAQHPELVPGQLSDLTALAAAQPSVPMLLRVDGSFGLFDPLHLAHIDWLALGSRVEFFAAVAVMGILPSIVRTSILESVLERDSEPDAQMRLVGASTMLSGLLGALPSSLSLSGSLGLRALGASGPLAGFVAGLTCLGFLLGGAPLLQHVPLFVPLGLLLATGFTMPVSWLMRDARNPLSRRDDLRAAWASCLLVALLGPVLGVFASLGLGAVLSLSRAASGGGIRFVQTGDVFHSNVDRSQAERAILRDRGGQILVLRLQGFVFFGTLHGLLRVITTRMAVQPLRFVLLDFGSVAGLGASAAIGFRRLEALARQHGLLLFLTSVPFELEENLEALGYRMADAGGVCRVALNLDYALEFCEDVILAEAGAREQRQDSLEELLAATFPEPRLVPALMKCLERVEAPKKTRLIQQGDASDCMYFLQSGRVHVELALPGGKLLRLKKMGPGTVFGEMGIYANAPRSASVVATERCVAYKLTVERFALIQQKAPQLAAAVNRFVVTLLAERVAEENAKNRAAQM
jgi:SulP family sulfate permease